MIWPPYLSVPPSSLRPRSRAAAATCGRGRCEVATLSIFWGYFCLKRYFNWLRLFVKILEGHPVGGQNRVRFGIFAVFPQFERVLGPKNGQNWDKIGSIWHIFPFLGPLFVLCLLAFGGHCLQVLVLQVFGKPPQNAKSTPFLPIYKDTL